MEYRKLFEGTLYHFCAGKFLPSINKTGLRYGRIPFSSDGQRIKLLPGYQWLTSNPEFTQSWNEGSTLQYDRTEYRLTIILPTSVRFSLIKWTDYNKDNPNFLFDTLNEYGDFENWYLFKGVVIPYWIANVHNKGFAQLVQPSV